ncbi:MAG: ATP-binding cassette domain-containing protein [Actinomycetota bacterium]|nr:ATP-binding cassette domain-containing protein [Actinomycetota bacterium]
MVTAVSAQSLARRFGSVDAVRGVDLAVGEGEIYGFLGPNGAGKSTCVRMLCTLLRPSSGSASVAGLDVVADAEAVRLRIGVALQEAALSDNLTGRELLWVQARLYGLSSEDIVTRIDELGDLVDRGALDRFTKEYSGGMRRRLDLAAALMHNPDVLFLDEPTTGLDPASRTRVWDEVRRLREELGKTIFLTTQYLEEADALADRVGIIDRGRIVAEGTPAELKRRIGTDVIVVTVAGPTDGAATDGVAAGDAGDGHDPADPTGGLAERASQVAWRIPGVTSIDIHGAELTVGVKDGAAAVSPMAVALSEAGIRVGELTLRTPTLDDVFLELTGAHLQEEP